MNCTHVYRDQNKLVATAGESPPQFRGVVFVVYEGESPETVRESVRTTHQLEGLVTVDPQTLSPEWRRALRLPLVEASKPSPQHPSDCDTHERSERDGSGRDVLVLNPGISKTAIPYFIGMALIGMLGFKEINPFFLALCIGGAFWAVFYQCALVYMVEHGKTEPYPGTKRKNQRTRSNANSRHRSRQVRW